MWQKAQTIEISYLPTMAPQTRRNRTIATCIQACKKDSQTKSTKTITVKVTGVDAALTTYNLTVRNESKKSTVIGVKNNNSSLSTIYLLTQGMKLRLSTYFKTKGTESGAGFIDFDLQGKNLLHVNGGSGTQLF
jgi:UDP-N-acetylmuramyl tripeptide synthase